MKENYFMGADGFVWFTGVVEDRDDPEKLGRVRVRCLGWHSESLLDIPKSDLPWADCKITSKFYERNVLWEHVELR